MKVMNLGNEDEPAVKKKKSNSRNLKIVLGLAAVILVPTIGSTLAGSITVGTAGAIEFGQGVITTAACDSAITVSPASTLTGGIFNLDTITVTGIDATACVNKYFTFKVLDSSNAAQVISTAGTTTLCKIRFIPSGTSTVAVACGTISGSSNEGFNFTTSAPLASSHVDKITIESSTS